MLYIIWDKHYSMFNLNFIVIITHTSTNCLYKNMACNLRCHWKPKEIIDTHTDQLQVSTIVQYNINIWSTSQHLNICRSSWILDHNVIAKTFSLSLLNNAIHSNTTIHNKVWDNYYSCSIWILLLSSHIQVLTAYIKNDLRCHWNPT